MNSKIESVSGKVWFVVTLEVPGVEAEGIKEWVRTQWGLEAVELSRPNQDRSWLELYFEDEVAAELAKRCLPQLFADCLCSIRRCEDRDWQSFWRLHFKPQEIGDQLFICPEWIDEEVDGRIRIWIRPGLSFGTGNHFTTRFCLEALDQLGDHLKGAHVIDLGTGSAILAVAALKLGAQHVVAIDHDEFSMEQARINAELNGVLAGIELKRLDLTHDTLSETGPVVCANIYGALLIELAPIIARAAEKHLILSGIRSIELDAVAETYTGFGFNELIRDSDGEWAGLVLKKRSA